MKLPDILINRTEKGPEQSTSFSKVRSAFSTIDLGITATKNNFNARKRTLIDLFCHTTTGEFYKPAAQK